MGFGSENGYVTITVSFTVTDWADESMQGTKVAASKAAMAINPECLIIWSVIMCQTNIVKSSYDWTGGLCRTILYPIAAMNMLISGEIM